MNHYNVNKTLPVVAGGVVYWVAGGVVYWVTGGLVYWVTAPGKKEHG